MILWADDYGIAPGVNDAIRELLSLGKIQATSVMVNFPEAKSDLERLRPFRDKARIGWHLTLTGARPLTRPPYRSGLVDAQGEFLTWQKLAFRALSGALDRAALKAELIRQWETFEDHLGHSPRFIDGHQHVQQFPGVFEVLAEVIQEKAERTFLRSAALPWSWLLRHPKLASWNGGMLLAGGKFRSRLRQSGIPTNRFLLGGYNPESENFENVFRRYLELGPTEEDVFYCHPGIPDATLARRDRLVDERKREYLFLANLENALGRTQTHTGRP